MANGFMIECNILLTLLVHSCAEAEPFRSPRVHFVSQRRLRRRTVLVAQEEEVLVVVEQVEGVGVQVVEAHAGVDVAVRVGRRRRQLDALRCARLRVQELKVRVTNTCTQDIEKGHFWKRQGVTKQNRTNKEATTYNLESVTMGVSSCSHDEGTRVVEHDLRVPVTVVTQTPRPLMGQSNDLIKEMVQNQNSVVLDQTLANETFLSVSKTTHFFVVLFSSYEGLFDKRLHSLQLWLVLIQNVVPVVPEPVVGVPGQYPESWPDELAEVTSVVERFNLLIFPSRQHSPSLSEHLVQFLNLGPWRKIQIRWKHF